MEKFQNRFKKIKNHVRAHFSLKIILSTDSLLAKIKSGSLFVYFQCNLIVPDELKLKFANFPPTFKGTEMEGVILETT